MPKPKRHLGWIALLICLLVAETHAKPSLQERECLIGTDFHLVHLSAFQPGQRKEGSEFERYCQQLPRTGLTYLGIDFMDRDVRHLPVALAVVEEDAQRTLLELAPQAYVHGVASLQVNFDRPGRYAVLVRFQGEDLTDELRIPLTVGASSPWRPIALGGGAVMLCLGLGVYWWRRRR